MTNTLKGIKTLIVNTSPSSQKMLGLMDIAAKSGVSDFLQVPYSVDDIAGRLRFLLGSDAKKLEQQNVAYQKATPAVAKAWPEEEESLTLTNMLLDHYIKHHEIVLMKLKFAQAATRKSIGEIRAVHEKIKDKSGSGLESFKDFDAMWEDIIGLFVEGGVSEDDIFAVEGMITKIPKEVEQHYSELSEQDRNFLAAVESLNRSAYQKAREKVIGLQKSPNPLSGRTAAEYQAHGGAASPVGRFFNEPSIRDVVSGN